MFDAGDTKHLHIEFFIEPVENPKLSREQGRPIYDDREMVRIKFVGDPKKELVAPAHDKFTRDGQSGEWITYAQAYHRHYDAFKTGEAVKGSGTPLEELPFISASKRTELKALNVHTAEALAQLEGTNLQRLGMFGREMKNQAMAYIERARDSALETRLSAENAELKERLAALEAMMRAVPQARQTLADPPQAEGVAPSGSTFDSWPDVELKSFIKDQTGQAPKGQPSHATLVRLAEEANAKEAA